MHAIHDENSTRRPARSLRLRLAIGAAGLCTAALMSAATAQSTVIDIPLPRQADWSISSLRHEGVATVRATTQNAAFRETGTWRIEFILPASTGPGGSNDSLALLYQLQGWDPATQGGIDKVDIRMDIAGAFSSFASGTTGAIRPIVSQDGQIYSVSGSGISINRSTVGPTTWSLLATDNWVQINAETGLDLSATGKPLLFGFRFDLGTTCSGLNGCAAASTVTTVNNPRFEIYPVAAAVPEPASWALLLAGAALVGARARARSRGSKRLPAAR
jgi:hypothetical protein